MPRRKVYHLRFIKKRWELKGASAKQASRIFTTKEKALKESPTIVRNQNPSQLVIHKLDGKIEDTRNYG
jgi:hypothetical protein